MGFYLTYPLLFLFSLVARGEGYCWQAGHNPGFTSPPRVTQLAMNRVRVSWRGLVTQEKCADNYLVKYWQHHAPGDYDITHTVPKGTYEVDIAVVPKVLYQFQAVAREEKGKIGGVDWNKSPLVSFKTMSERMRQAELEHSGGGEEVVTGANRAGEQEDSGSQILGFSVEVFLILVVGGLILTLVVIGTIYRVTCGRRRSLAWDEDSDDEGEGEGDGNGDGESA